MPIRIILALFLLFSSSRCIRRNPARQVGGSLFIDTPQFSLTVPGQWRAEFDAPVESLVYSGVATDGPLTKRFFANVYGVTENLSEEEWKTRFERFMQGRKENEDKITHHEQHFIDEQTRKSDDLLVGGYVSIDPTRHRVAFSRDMADRKVIVHIGYEVAGFHSAPDLAALTRDFDKIAKSARIKSSNHHEPADTSFSVNLNFAQAESFLGLAAL